MNYIPAHAPTLREYYEYRLAREAAEEYRPATLKEILIALRHWERCTGNPVITEVSHEHVRMLRDELLQNGGRPGGKPLAGSTVEKTWAHLVPMFKAAKGDAILAEVPQCGMLRKSILPKQLRNQRRQQRQPVTHHELELLFAGCAWATYPPRADCVLIWRALLYFFWTYGMRTRDLMQLRAADWDRQSRLLRFSAQKTSKLQGLPLTAVGLRLLDRLSSPGVERVFPGLLKSGGWNVPRDGKPAHWVNGYNATWNREILASQGVIPHTGPAEWRAELASRPGAIPTVQLKALRQTMVTELNDFSAQVHSCRQLGGWVAGHYQPGVTAQNYDMPSEEIRRAIELREEQRLPRCFWQLVE